MTQIRPTSKLKAIPLKEGKSDYTPQCPFCTYHDDLRRAKYMYGKCEKSVLAIDSYRHKKATATFAPALGVPASLKLAPVKVSKEDEPGQLPALLSPSLPSPIIGDDLF